MNSLLLEWGLFSFMIGIVLSLPLAAVYYQKETIMTKVFTNARNLKSAHLDFFMQSFALGLAYLLELSFQTEIPLYVVLPQIYGTIMNPTILLLEATPYIRTRGMQTFYKVLRGTSPLALMFAWFAIAFLFLPMLLKIILLVVVMIGLIGYFTLLFDKNKQS